MRALRCALPSASSGPRAVLPLRFALALPPALPLALALATAGFAIAGPAAAAPRDPLAAEALFRSGREALKRGDWATACADLAASQSLDPAGGTALNLAVCEERQGHVASAWQRLREAIDVLPPGDDRLPLARKRVAELEPRVPHLRVRVAPDAPPGTRVTRDEVDVAGVLFGFAQPIDPGAHVVRATAPGFAVRTYPVISREGITDDLEVQPGDTLEVAAGVDRGRRTAGWLVLGTGAASIAIGAVAGLGVIERNHARQQICSGSQCRTQAEVDDARNVDAQGKTLSLVSTTAFAVGGAAAAAGIYLLLTSHGREAPPGAPGVSLAPAVGPRDAALSLVGSF
jgi:hypothetical protein